jgi:DNA gyrase/topoisomerase IV subunit A
VLFDEQGRLGRYATEEDIIKHWYDLRADLYERRKEYMLAKLRKEYEVLKNKARFIKMVIEEEIQIKRVKRAFIAQQLKQHGFLTKD